MKTFPLYLLILFFLPSALEAQYNVRAFGAKGDGATLDTRFIQSAIDKAYEKKGGVVDIPPGTYKIGTLILKDNVELHLQSGAILLGSSNYKDYKTVNQKLESRTRDLYAKYFMIFAEGAKNISITGTGTIHGNGQQHFLETKPQNLRPFMIRLVNCSNINISDVYLLESANWTLHLLSCKDVNINNIVIENEAEGNRDGLDIDACQRVNVVNSRFRTTDDAIVMKATTDTLCQDITISNCQLRSGGSAIKTGTESNGGFKNITVSNCVITDIDTHAGIELITVDGGIMQNILLENIAMDRVVTPFFIRLGIRARPFKSGQYVSAIGEVRDIMLNNISVTNAKLPSSIMGLHNKKIQNITVSNYTVRYAFTQNATAYNQVSFEEFEYPMALMFKELPAYAIYCRNVDGLQLRNVNMYAADNEKRTAVTLDRVQNAELMSVTTNSKGNGTPLLHLRNSNNIITGFCRSSDANTALIETEENSVADFHVINNRVYPSQIEINKMTTLPDASIFEDFETAIKYSVEQGSKVNGLTAHDLTSPLRVDLNIIKRGTLQLCLLALNESIKPSKILVKYQGITQAFTVDWNEWGWAPLSLLKTYPENEKVSFEIMAADPNSGLKISKLYMRYQDIGFTD